ncbi:Killer cell lectin-like receptor subfamily F member 2, partial [Galemys pyrenaicus]
NKSTCPHDWQLNQGKCYRFLTSSKTWHGSQHDCVKLQAHLLVIQSSEELEFIRMNLKLGQPGWIGLYFITSEGNQWMWVDKQPFVEQTNFLVIGPMDNMSCAVITGRQIYSEDCNAKFNGICQRDAI